MATDVALLTCHAAARPQLVDGREVHVAREAVRASEVRAPAGI